MLSGALYKAMIKALIAFYNKEALRSIKVSSYSAKLRLVEIEFKPPL